MIFFNVIFTGLVLVILYFSMNNQMNDQNNAIPCNQDDKYKLMSTKTSYDLIANKENLNDYEIPSNLNYLIICKYF